MDIWKLSSVSYRTLSPFGHCPASNHKTTVRAFIYEDSSMRISEPLKKQTKITEVKVGSG